MSTDTTDTTDATPKAKPKAKRDTTSMVKLSSVYATVASRKGTDTTAAAKVVRGKLRANFDTAKKLSPNVAKAKKSANDGNRWPSVITRDLAKFLLGQK